MLAATVAAIVFSLLTIAALLSTVSPMLTSLSSHGKTRLMSSNCGHDNPRCHDHDEQSSVSRRWQQQQHFVGNCKFTVNKGRFIDFYATGIIVSMLILICNANVMGRDDFLPTCLLMTHLIRRYCECIWVHKPGALSQLHVAGYLLGILHYLCIPFILISYHPYNMICSTFDNPFQGGDIGGKQCDDESSPTDILPFTSMARFLNGFAIFGCIYFQYQQHRHHVILANLRGAGEAMPNKTIQYSTPNGGWFEYVSCPHYFSEIMIYITFAIIMNDVSYISRERSVEAWLADCNHFLVIPTQLCGSLADTRWMDTLVAIHNSRNSILCMWVTTNLAISADRTHNWYRNYFGTSYPQQRMRLVPFVW